MVIWFNCEKARNQLKFHGKVITCRIRRKQFGFTTAVYTNQQNVKVIIGRVNVQMKEETIDNLVLGMDVRPHRVAFRDYLDSSGFDSVREWEEKVLSLNSKGKIPSYLIFLEVTTMDVFT